MARYTGPKEKRERRLGKKLFLKGERSSSPKSATVRRMYPPGVHGKRPNMRMSEYGRQLQSKQRVKETYRMLERQFKNWIREAMKNKKETSNAIMSKLEHRLDNIVYRAGIAQSRDQARQLVNHGHITVNGKKVGIPSYSTKKDDVIEVREGSRKSPYFTTQVPQWIQKYQPPRWIALDNVALRAEITGIPTIEDSGLDVSDIQAVIEFYSR
ncbi:MAG: 30S ribosomal protein S4 [Parcubacteria group bacterium]